MHVLLPVDADEGRAVAAAETVTTLPHADETVKVTILNVQKKLEVTGSEGRRIESAEWYDPREFPPSVERAEAVLADAGIAVEKRRVHADPAAAIVEVADELGADWIIMAGRRRTPVGKVLFGSVTQSVLLSADVPVTMVAV